MNSELRNLKNPTRIRILWAVLYIIIAVLCLFGLYASANQIRTHTLPTGQIELIVPYSKYLEGEVVTFTLKNNYNSPVYVQNNCPQEPLEVYYQVNGTWVRQHDTASAKDCPTETRQVSVPANGVVNGSFAAWHNLFRRPGKYRVVAFVEYYNALPFQDFEVISPPPVLPKTSTTNSSKDDSTPSTPAAPQPSSPTNTARKSKTISTAQGTIKVEYDDTTIYVISITPAAGCTKEGGRSGRQVEVTFICSGNQTQLQLTISNGTIHVQTETSRGGD